MVPKYSLATLIFLGAFNYSYRYFAVWISLLLAK